MITLALAQALRGAGLQWTPVSGDRFVVPDRDMDDQIFVVSEMTIEVREAVGGAELKFNGTTEWALDSIDASAALWLPRENQLRSALGERFVSLEQGTDSFAVTVLTSRGRHRVVDNDAECAYARAWLALYG